MRNVFLSSKCMYRDQSNIKSFNNQYKYENHARFSVETEYLFSTEKGFFYKISTSVHKGKYTSTEGNSIMPMSSLST